MASARAQAETPGGHPRLLRCRVVNANGEESVRYVELEQFRLWEYMLRTRHGIEVRDVQLGLWLDSNEFKANTDLFAHGGSVEKVTRITLSLFNPRHGYTLDVDRFVPVAQRETVKRILLSHMAKPELASQFIKMDDRHGVCVNRIIDDPDVELILGLSDLEAYAGGTVAA